MCMLASAFLFFSYKMNASTPLHVNDWKVDLAPLGEDWSNLCILGPYSTNEPALSVNRSESALCYMCYLRSSVTGAKIAPNPLI
jgi:hypothetical protein